MKKKFLVTGMTCAACQSHVEKAVAALGGVRSVSVNLLGGNMTADFDEKTCSEKEIIAAVEKAGYGISPEGVKEKTPAKQIKDRSLPKLIFCLIDLLVIMYVSMGNMMWGFPLPPVFDVSHNPTGFALLQFLLVLPIVYIYRNYFISGFRKLFNGHPNMDTLIAVGATFSLAYGIYCLFMISLGHSEYHMFLYFESAGMILVFVSIGKFLEGVSAKKTTDAITRLMDLAPKTANLLENGEEKKIDVSLVKVGDILVVRKGDAVPVDGTVISGKASIDQSNVTGESVPVFKQAGDGVFSSCTVTSGYLEIRATKVGEDTSIATIIKLVEEAANSKAPISKLADKISGIFVPIILVVAALVFAANILYATFAHPDYVLNAFETALNFAITVIVIACPCALGLATPVAIMVGTGKGAENGLLIKNAEILENAHKINVAVLDKTGTLTKGKPEVVDFEKLVDFDMASVLYSFEHRSEHPLASAITEYVKDKKTEVSEITDFRAEDGKGLRGVIGKDVYEIGNLRFLQSVDPALRKKLDEYSEQGKTPLLVIRNGIPVGIVTVRDEPKESSAEAVRLLKKEGIRVIMLTGDNEKTAKSIGAEVGADEVISDVLPQDKAQVIKDLQNKGNFVAMIGDGVNDALALTTADIGIAIGAGSNVAIESADLILLRNDLLDVRNAIALSKRVIRTIKLGLFWAFFYNAICVLLATGLFYYLSGGAFKMQPMYGSIAMSLSSVSVVLNALTINFFKVKRSAKTENNIKKEYVMKDLTIKVDGMMCAHCKARVEKVCSEVPGVVSATVSLEDKSVAVTCGEEVKREDLVKKITEAGYDVIG